MPVLPQTTKITDVSKFGLYGLNSFDEPASIDNLELSNLRNVIFDDGILQPRKGSLLAIAKPAGETANPFQMLIATNSAGVDYLIAVYGTNFYLWDETNAQWIKINTTFTPATTGVFYGSANWNNGTVDDRFYFGNGVDDTMKWIMAVNTVKTTTTSADTTITLNSAESFPQSGNLIVVNAGSSFNLPYTAINKTYTADTIAFVISGTTYTITDSANGFITAGFSIGDVIQVSGTHNNNSQFKITNVAAGTLTVGEETIAESAGDNFTLTGTKGQVIKLSGTVGQIVPAGSTVTVPITDATTVPVGSIFTKFYGRLWVTNSQGYENGVHYSHSGNPEDYDTSGGIDAGGSFVLFEGKGGILGAIDYGAYLVMLKEDIIYQIVPEPASDLSSIYFQPIPLISGDGIGPANTAEVLKYMNLLYYPTDGEGIISFNPAQTGTSTGSNLNLLSQKINNIVVEDLDFSISRTTGFGQKLYWLCSLSTIGTPLGVNNLVLMYDLVRAGENQTQSAWTIFDNWNAVDIKPVNGILYYLSQGDGALYQTGEGYQDVLESQPHPYTAYALSKRFNLDSPATLFRCQFIYLEGFISINTTLYVTIYDNENGSLGSQSYQIAGNNPNIISPFTAGLARFMLASPLLGGVDLATLPSNQATLQFFRVYLETSQAFRPHNVQAAIFSVDEGSQWGVSKLSIVSQPEQSVETSLVLSPSSAPIVTEDL